MIRNLHHYVHIRIILISVCSFFWVPLVAQQDTTSTTLQVRQLLAIPFEDLLNIPVSSGSKISQTVSESPCIVSVVTHNQMNQFQWESLNDIAEEQAGFTLGQDRNSLVIDSRGITDLSWSNRLLILFDGVPFSSFQSSVTDDALSLNMAKDVEVIRGPGSVLYGSEAVTGVMQVNSMSYSDLNGNSIVELKGGDDAYHSINLLTGASGKYANVLISFNNTYTDGNEYESYDLLTGLDGNYTKQMTQDEQGSTHFFAKIEGKDKLAGFSLSYHFQDYNFQMGHGFLDIIPTTNNEPSNVSRNYVVAKYVTPSSYAKFIHEYVLQYDYEVSDYNMQLIPSGLVLTNPKTGKPDSSIFAGLYEHYITPVSSAFARTQWTYLFNNKATLLGGIEQSMVYYGGDILHQSNYNLNAGAGTTPFPMGAVEDLEPLYKPILGHPINNTGFYGQFTSGHLLGNNLQATLGARYDIYYYNYNSIATGKDTTRNPVTHFSPRASLVYTVDKDLSFKADISNAFRVASPFEQFITNSLISGTGRVNLSPENLTDEEVSCDWTINKQINWRNTLFYSVYQNIITYGPSPNPTPSPSYNFINALSSTQEGAETELHFYLHSFSAFVNYSFVKRLNETTTNPYIITSNSLVWYPSNVVNAGISYPFKKFELSIQGHYQCVVERYSDENTPLTDSLRGSSVKPWFTIDMNLNYHITSRLEIRIASTNILNAQYDLVNNLFGGLIPVPFDYQQAGRRIILSLKATL